MTMKLTRDRACPDTTQAEEERWRVISASSVYVPSRTVKNKLSMHSGLCVFSLYCMSYCHLDITVDSEALEMKYKTPWIQSFELVQVYEISTRHSSLIFSMLEKLSPLDKHLNSRNVRYLQIIHNEH